MGACVIDIYSGGRPSETQMIRGGGSTVTDIDDVVFSQQITAPANRYGSVGEAVM
jgi:hypothetical protein